MNYHKKQKKHTRSIFLNTEEAFYVDSERKTFQFRINPINIEDESRLYVKNTITDYKSSGLAVKSVNTGLFLGSTATFSTTYSANPAITFISQDGKGTGATAIGLLAPSGLSGSATATTTTPINLSNAGAGYTGVAGDYVVNAKPCPFLGSNNFCSIYEVRPSDCSRFPYTDEDVLFKRPALTLKNVTFCPAVFAVMEKLTEVK